MKKIFCPALFIFSAISNFAQERTIEIQAPLAAVK
jgi:hypothetical protein